MAITDIIDGLPALQRKLERMQNPIAYRAAMNKACRVVEADAKRNVHRVTGNLEASITHEVTVESGQIVGYVGSNLEYAPYEEFGTGIYAEKGNGRQNVPWSYTDPDTGERIWTKGNHPHPYLRPALNNNVRRIQGILQQGANDAAGGIL